MPVLDAAACQQFLRDAFPDDPPSSVVDAVGDRWIRLRQPAEQAYLRPGGTIAGPVLMRLADAATYVAIAAEAGPLFMAVTSSFHMDFLARPRPGHVVAEARLVKLGRRLAVCRVDLTDASDRLVAVATVTYAMPVDEGASAPDAGQRPST